MPFARRDTLLRDTLNGTALTVLISVTAVSIPFVGFFCLLLLPQPLIFYRLKLGRRPGLVILAAAFPLAAFSTGGFSADSAFLLCMMGLGFLMAEFIELRLNAEKTIGYASGAVMAAALGAAAVYSGLLDINIVTWIHGYIEESLEMTAEMYRSAGMQEESIRVLQESMESLAHTILQILPGIAACGLLLAGWLNLLAARVVFRARRSILEPYYGLNTWKAPEMLVWAAIAGIAMLLLPGTAVKILGLNILLVLMVVYFFQGAAVMNYYLEKKSVPPSLRWLIYAFLAVQQFFLLVIVGLGFFDVWANFRRLEAHAADDSNGAGN